MEKDDVDDYGSREIHGEGQSFKAVLVTYISDPSETEYHHFMYPD